MDRSSRPARITLATAAGTALLVAGFAAGRAGGPATWSPPGSPGAGPGGAGGTAARTVAGYAFGGMPADGRVPAAGGWYATAFGEGTAADGVAAAAIGSGSEAAGHASLAGGLDTRAAGDYATALGARSQASGYAATALGYGTAATGHASTAFGHATVADGDRSTALGSYASTGGRAGAFVYGDNSTTDVVTASRDDEFLVRASGGVTFRATPHLGGGVTLMPGSGSWSSGVDSAVLREVEPVRGEAVLTALMDLPIGTWRFAAEDGTVRHMGPTAQAFRRAFGLGASDAAIATVDADGVALAGVRALAERTAELRRERDALRSAVEALAARVDALEARGGPDSPH